MACVPICAFTPACGLKSFWLTNSLRPILKISAPLLQIFHKLRPRRLVLISTIDVYQNSLGAMEIHPGRADGLHPYGRHRLHLERWAQENVPCCHILRLPALYGKNLKKNFLYDLIHVVPSLLTEEKHAWFSQKSPLVGKAYENQGNGFYRCAATSPSDLAFLKEFFTREGFTALSFTDSRAVFQFYGLHYLWGHIKFATENEIPLLNLATEPVSAGEIYAAAKGGAFENEICDRPPVYGFKTIYANCLGGKNGYIFDKQRVLGDILTFLEETTC